MEKTHEPCDSEMLSRFFDNELESDEHTLTDAHLSTCSECRKTLSEYQRLSGFFAGGFQKAVLHHSHPDMLETALLNRIRKTRPRPMTKFSSLLTSGRVLIPAAAALGLFLFFYFSPDIPIPVAGPSAIINSFSGDTSSVMIMETPESRQTIIWFNETPKTEDKDEADNKDKVAVGYFSRTDTDFTGTGRA